MECKLRKPAWVSATVYFTASSTIVNSRMRLCALQARQSRKVEIRGEPTPYLTAGETSSTHVDKDAAVVRRAVMLYDHRARILHVSRQPARWARLCKLTVFLSREDQERRLG